MFFCSCFCFSFRFLSLSLSLSLRHQSDPKQVYEITTRQKYQFSPLPLDQVLRGTETDQVSEHRLLGITIDSKLRWDSLTENVCKPLSRRVFLLSKLRYFVDINNRKLFFNVNSIAYIDCASLVWDVCSDVLKKSCKIIFPGSILTTDQYFCLKMGIMSLHEQLEYNKGFPCTVYLKKGVPRVYISNLHHPIPTLGAIILICLGQGYTFSKQV